MKKKWLIIFYLFIFFYLSADYKNELYQTAYKEISISINEKVGSSGVFIYGDFMGNDGQNFSKFLFSELTRENQYHFINRENLKKIFYEQISLNDPIYEVQTNQIKFKKPQWIIEGECNYTEKIVWWKKKSYLQIDFSLSNIQNGTNDIIFHKMYTKFWEVPIIYSVLFVILIILFCRSLVQKFKGYYNFLIYFLGLIILAIYFIWLHL